MISRFLLGTMVSLMAYALVAGQNSPFPVISNYAGQSLAPPWSLGDSTFCKGLALFVNGDNYISTGNGDTFDSFRVMLDTFSCQVLQLAATPLGNADSVKVLIPDIFQRDTCLPLYLIKYVSNGFGTIPYVTQDTICLTGDYVDLAYADSVFCLGDTNPRPEVWISTDSAGSFCCFNGAAGFQVLQNGEIPLHSGAVGLGQTFLYHTTHGACPDTVRFEIDIHNQSIPQATIQGGTQISVCPSGNVLSDTASFWPKGGHFYAPDSSLVLLDDSIGLIDLSQTPPGTYQLYYHVPFPCYDSALLVIEVLPRDSVLLAYPIPYQGSLQVVCPNHSPIAPLFQIGPSGGQFASLPNTLVLDTNGVIDPMSSAPGNYTVMYTSPGTCPDTAIAALNLTIGTLPDASFVILPEEVCAGDSFLVIDTVVNPGYLEVLSQGSIIHTTTQMQIPVAGLFTPGSTYLIQHVQLGNGICRDTAWDFITVLPEEDASFAYDPDFYCLGDNDPTPLIFGDGGGRFRGMTSATIVDSLGRIDLAGSGPGQHIIQYLTNGQCPDSLLDTVTINNSVNAYFNYSQSQYCKSDSNPLPTIASSGGSFSAVPSGLTINSSNGRIDLVQSDPGLYEVTYSFIGSCQTSYSHTIFVRDFTGLPTLIYPKDTFCRDSTSPTPILATDSPGVFIGSAGVVFLNPAIGSIDLSLTPPGGPYWVRYNLANICAVDPADTFFILEEPYLSFSYPRDEVCEGDSFLSPAVEVIPQSRISFSTLGGLAMDSVGVIDPSISQPGTYNITCRTHSICPATQETKMTIYPKPQFAQMIIEPGNTICKGDTIQVTLSAHDGISFNFLLNGTSLNSPFFHLELDSLENGDALEGIIGNAFACQDTISEWITVLPRPELTVSPHSGSHLSDGRLSLEINSSNTNTSVDWQLLFQTSLLDSGEIARIGPGISQWLNLSLEAATLDPTRYEVLLQPESQGCPGPPRRLEYTILDKPFFVPEVITPNGDGQNDLWKIVWLNRIQPDGYTIQVFNRAGGKVHEMLATDEWDGGSHPDGVYWWQIQGPQGEYLQRGGLTIRRK